MALLHSKCGLFVSMWIENVECVDDFLPANVLNFQHFLKFALMFCLDFLRKLKLSTFCQQWVNLLFFQSFPLMYFAFFSNKYDPIAIWTTHLTGLVVELFVFYSVWLWLGCYLHLPNRDLATICFNLNSDFGTKYGPYVRYCYS